MKSPRFPILSVLTACTAMIPVSPAFAGFELIAPPRQARVETPAVTPPQDFPPTVSMQEQPMPIAPAPDVEQVHITETGAPAQMSRSYAEQGRNVYLPEAVATRSSGSVELYIDPYPMQSNQARHAEPAGMERAMLKESGHLKGVATSGNRISMVPANGTVKSVSRYDGSIVEQPGSRNPSRIDGWTSSSTAITPMMGGEGRPLPVPTYAAPVESMPVYPDPVSVEEASYQPPVAVPSYPAPAPLVPRAPDQMPRAATPAPVATEQSGFSEAVGFGRDLPLALALSQVVPPDYTFSFANDVNAGENVSWQGGKPWNEVLNEMLAPAGMRAAISGNQVIVQNAS